MSAFKPSKTCFSVVVDGKFLLRGKNRGPSQKYFVVINIMLQILNINRLYVCKTWNIDLSQGSAIFNI